MLSSGSPCTGTIQNMSTTTRQPEDHKENLENPSTTTFATLLAEVERMSAELQTMQSQFTRNFQQSLSDAEQMVRKQIVNELRAKFGRELELAMTEKDLVYR